MHRRAALPLIACLALVACASPSPTAPATATRAGNGGVAKAAASPSPAADPMPGASNGGGLALPSAAPALPTITAIAGTVTAPASLVAAGGVGLIGADGASLVAAGAGNLVAAGAGNLVAAGAGNIVAAGAGNLVAAGAGNYALRQASDSAAARPVARARVYLTAGDAVLPIAPVETDALGNYRFPKVPSGLTYQVVVSIVTPDGKTGRLASLVRPDAVGGVADVSPATTMVCAATVGTKKALGDVDPAAFQAAAAAVGKLIATQAGAGLDLADPTALAGKVAGLVASSPEAQQAIASVKTAVEKDAKGATEVASLVQRLDVSTCAIADVVAAPTPNAPGDLPAAPSAIAVGPGGTLYLGDRERQRVVVVRDGKLVRTLDKLEPLALAVAGDAVYVGDGLEGRVVKVTADGATTEVVAAEAGEPVAIAVAADGTVYFADASRHAVYRVAAAGGAPQLLVGGKPGYAEGPAAVARLYRPSGLALVGDLLYVADAGNRRIRRISLAGEPEIAMVAGSGAPGGTDGTGAAARFGYPAAIAADGTGTLWVADAASRTIRRVSTTGLVETVLDGGCVLDAQGLSYSGGLTFADAALWVLDGDRVVRRPVGPQPSPSASPAGSPAPDASASPSPSPSPSATTSPAG